jgi:hypothetical protein
MTWSYYTSTLTLITRVIRCTTTVTELGHAMASRSAVGAELDTLLWLSRTTRTIIPIHFSTVNSTNGKFKSYRIGFGLEIRSIHEALPRMSTFYGGSCILRNVGIMYNIAGHVIYWTSGSTTTSGESLITKGVRLIVYPVGITTACDVGTESLP